MIENTEVIKTKDYDKNSTNTTITTDDTTTNREGETESVYKEEGLCDLTFFSKTSN